MKMCDGEAFWFLMSQKAIDKVDRMKAKIVVL